MVDILGFSGDDDDDGGGWSDGLLMPCEVVAPVAGVTPATVLAVHRVTIHTAGSPPPGVLALVLARKSVQAADTGPVAEQGAGLGLDHGHHLLGHPGPRFRPRPLAFPHPSRPSVRLEHDGHPPADAPAAPQASL